MNSNHQREHATGTGANGRASQRAATSGLIRPSRICRFLAIISLAVMSCEAAQVNQSKRAIGFPETLMHTVQAGHRFADPGYFHLMAGDGLRSVDPRALYARLQSAVQAKEKYKALYFATIFTQVQPASPAGWSNRAALAETFGLSSEAALCRKNAADPAHAQTVSSTLLPGSALRYRPVSLPDWAAALALVADSVAGKGGAHSLLAFRDDVSGIHQATQQEIADANASAQSAGLPPTGPWAIAEPARLQDVLANIFLLQSGKPMNYRFESRGGAFTAGLLAAVSGLDAAYNPAQAQAAAQLAQEETQRASQIPSHYTGGSYTEAAYRGEVELWGVRNPKASGQNQAIGSPVPLLLASGGSFNPIYVGEWAAGEKPFLKRITESDLKTRKDIKYQQRRPPEILNFPKLITLCADLCTPPVTLAELLLTKGDVAALAPSLSPISTDKDVVTDSISYVSRYFPSGQITIQGSFRGFEYVAFDDRGITYVLRWSPAEWIIPISHQ